MHSSLRGYKLNRWTLPEHRIYSGRMTFTTT